MKKITRKKLVLCIGILALFVLVAPQLAHAAIWDIFSPTMILTSVLRGIAYIISFVFGVLFMIANFFVGIAMNFNDQILSTSNSLVVVGWRISRDIANLGFVLLIIVIAFATILRIESYNAKKLLPTLIGAAIIVNFSLAIGGVFINFAGTLSHSFLDRMGGGSAFTESLATAFGPQRLFLPPDNPPPPDPSEQGGAWTGFSAAILISIGNLTFISVFSLIAAMVMFLLAGMLMIRFITLSFLLIIAPIAWLFWVFPALKHLFSKWWNTFFQWVFFQPAMLFFIYLSILSLNFLGKTAQPSSSGNEVFGGLSTVITQGMQMLALCGFLIGGVIAAQKMGIAGAAGALKLGKEAGKASTAWMGKKAYKGITSPLREEGGRKFAERLQAKGGIRGRIGNILSNMGAVQGDQLVKDATKKQAHLSDKQLALRVATMKGENRVAALARLTKNKELDHVANGVASYIGDPATKLLFQRYGQGSAYTDMEKTAGFSMAMVGLLRDWQRAVQEGRPDAEVQAARRELEGATKRFEATYSMADFEKLQGNLFSAFDHERNNLGLSANDHKALGELRMGTVFEINPGAVARIRPKLKGADLVNFQKNLNNFINRFEEEIELPVELRGPKVVVVKKIKDIQDRHAGDPGIIARARSLYGTQNNLAGSLFGGGWAPIPHTGGAEETHEEEGV